MAVRPIENPSFETGNANGWIIPSGVTYQVTTAESTPFGIYTLRFTTGTPGQFDVLSEQEHQVFPTKRIKASCNYSQGPAAANRNVGRVVLVWYDEDMNRISESLGTLIFATGSVGWNQGRGMVLSSVDAEAPDGAAFVRIGVRVIKDSNDWCAVDNFVWDYQDLASPTITSPTGAGIYQEGSPVSLRSSFSVPSGMSVTQAKYYLEETTTADTLEYTANLNTSPWAVNADDIPEGEWKIKVQLTLNSGEIVTSPDVIFSVGEAPEPNTREYRASNSGTLLVMENFSSLASAIPSTALITGIEMILNYGVDLLGRTKDKDIEAASSNPDVLFDIVTGGTFSLQLLNTDGATYSVLGTNMSNSIDLDRADFTLQEDMLSDGLRWVVFESNLNKSVTIGSKTSLFGIETLAVQDFLNKAIGLKFHATTGSIPDTAEKGNAAVRTKIDYLRLRVYFDSGSVDYYFASPTKDDVLKGVLVASNVLGGDLKNGDGTGVMQLRPDIEIMEGHSETIFDNWTIHSQYPVSDENQIGITSNTMRYNGLPGYELVELNRSRYQFITSNFYGDERLNSVYGVNGYGRAFSFNGEDFYKIYTQPEADKDTPRHIAEHHLHLALGYAEGRVDVSVVGEPYNFDGAQGASSWGIGDGVTGLLKLSGTILGVFGSNSVSGLSGTTVDNFAVQTISPKMGAIEYTVVDMSYPVYANSYGIYTLSQTEQYGDYLGTPLSQDISPWLRPRLRRSKAAAAEVVCSWPVRTKNQYRLAFSDGYILTMTMNNGQQSAPSFSFQKYFKSGQDTPAYDNEAMVPAAVSSQLDHTGEERIHIADKSPVSLAPPPEPGECPIIEGYDAWGTGGNNARFYVDAIIGPVPDWLLDSEDGSILTADFYDDGTLKDYRYHENGRYWGETVSSGRIYGEESGRGVLFTNDGEDITCFNWAIPTGI